MTPDFLTRLKQSPVLCDGAMGTLLYAKGIFINRSYDELNLSQPDLIRGIHHEYLQAGAEIIETNTFGANSFRLGRHSLADKVSDINRAGVRIAREAAKSFDVWVAGSVGPLGTRIEPLGKTSFQEARDAFRQQIAVLVEGGIDLLMFETFGYLEEIHQAMLAARDVSATVPIVAQVTIDEDGNCLDGCHAQCRHAACCRRPQHLSLFAGIHGQLRPQIRGGGRSTGGRVLRNHSGAHSGNEVGPAGGRGPGKNRFHKIGARPVRADGRSGCAAARSIPARQQAGSRRVRHHGRDCPAERDRH